MKKIIISDIVWDTEDEDWGEQEDLTLPGRVEVAADDLDGYEDEADYLGEKYGFRVLGLSVDEIED